PGTAARRSPVDRLPPRTLNGAIDAGIMLNPAVTAAMYGVDVAVLQVKIAESTLYPVVTLQGSVQRAHDVTLALQEQFTASGIVNATIPIYQGGVEYSTIRQQK